MNELFSEIYGCYYTVVADLLHRAKADGLTSRQIDQLVAEKAFSESCVHLVPRLLSGQWDLLQEQNGRYWSKLSNGETQRPVSHLERSWLKALLADRRIQLFFTEAEQTRLEAALQETEPLFYGTDFHCFDQATDGDPYADARYRHHFRLALKAVREKETLWVHYRGGKGGDSSLDVLPLQIQYSEKDDKFRLLCAQSWGGKQVRHVILNVARILAIRPSRWQAPPLTFAEFWTDYGDKETVTFVIYPQRNALERALLQFAAYQKETSYLEERQCYLCRLQYDRLEETELLIRLLSFGPLVEVLAPESFRQSLKKRIQAQIQMMEAPL